MSHAEDTETRRVNESDNVPIRTRHVSDEFGPTVAKVAVAQICENVGFLGAKESALDSLADIAIRYLRDLGKMASYHANLAGRTESNVFDVVRGLEDLEAPHGFSGAGELRHCLVGSGTMKEIVRYVETEEEIPFAKALPWFPAVKNRKLIPSFWQIGEDSPGMHLPNWLPALPDPHTYVRSEMWNERKEDAREVMIEQARQRRKAERSLLSLQQRLLCNGSDASVELTSALVLAAGDDGKGLQLQAGERNPFLEPRKGLQLQAGERNPFLEPPLQPGEKDVSPVVLPSKFSDESDKGNGPSVSGSIVPENGVCMEEEGEVEHERKVLSNTRPPVRLKFRMVKKFDGESSDLSLQNKGSGRTASWVLEDEERDDKKRRAEIIVRQFMDNTHELNQT